MRVRNNLKRCWQAKGVRGTFWIDCMRILNCPPPLFFGYDKDGICLTIFELRFCTFLSQCALLDGFLLGVAFYPLCSRTAQSLQSPLPHLL